MNHRPGIHTTLGFAGFCDQKQCVEAGKNFGEGEVEDMIFWLREGAVRVDVVYLVGISLERIVVSWRGEGWKGGRRTVRS